MQRDAELLLFATPAGKRWTMKFFWSEHVKPRLEQLQREGNGGLTRECDLEAWGTNSPRRTWNTMAGMHPHPVSVDLRERQGRWRKKQKKRDRVHQEMVSLYFERDIGELLLATHWLSRIGPN